MFMISMDEIVGTFGDSTLGRIEVKTKNTSLSLRIEYLPQSLNLRGP